MRERIQALKALWTEEQASYHGEFVNIEPSFSWPKPKQQPYPPILLGGAPGPKLFKHIADWADGWIPIGGRGIKASLPALREEYEKAGRDPDKIKIVPFGSLPDQGKLEYFATLGIEEIVLGVQPGTRDVVLPVLDRFASVIETFKT